MLWHAMACTLARQNGPEFTRLTRARRSERGADAPLARLLDSAVCGADKQNAVHPVVGKLLKRGESVGPRGSPSCPQKLKFAPTPSPRPTQPAPDTHTVHPLRSANNMKTYRRSTSPSTTHRYTIHTTDVCRGPTPDIHRTDWNGSVARTFHTTLLSQDAERTPPFPTRPAPVL